MNLFQHILCLCIFNVLFVTGEEMFLLSKYGKLYWYNTQNKETKQIAENAESMACDYERKWLYYRIGIFSTIVRVRMDPVGGDMKIITEKDKDDGIGYCLGVDQETGNLYYASTKGLVFLSYKQNYTKTIISTRLTGPFGPVVYDVGVHGKGPNKRVYWSTLDSLYTSQVNNPQLTRLRLSCMVFSILDNGIVCGDIERRRLFLANLSGKRTESLPNISIQSSELLEIDCKPEDVTTLDGRMYFVCQYTNRVFQINLKTKTHKVFVPVLKGSDIWDSIWPLPDQKVVLPGQSVNTIPGTTILVVIIIVVIGIVLIAIIAVTILRYTKKNDSMSRRSDSHSIGEPEESQPPSTVVPRTSKNDQTKGSAYYSSLHNRSKECPLYDNGQPEESKLSSIVVPRTSKNDQTEGSIYPSSLDNRSETYKPEDCHLYDTIPFTEHKTSSPEYVEMM